MSITELIERLEQIRESHGDLPVRVDGYEDGYEDPSSIGVEDMFEVDANEKAASWWNGRYRDYRYSHRQVIERAVVIHR